MIKFSFVRVQFVCYMALQQSLCLSWMVKSKSIALSIQNFCSHKIHLLKIFQTHTPFVSIWYTPLVSNGQLLADIPSPPWPMVRFWQYPPSGGWLKMWTALYRLHHSCQQCVHSSTFGNQHWSGQWIFMWEKLSCADHHWCREFLINYIWPKLLTSTYPWQCAFSLHPTPPWYWCAAKWWWRREERLCSPPDPTSAPTRVWSTVDHFRPARQQPLASPDYDLPPHHYLQRSYNPCCHQAVPAHYCLALHACDHDDCQHLSQVHQAPSSSSAASPGWLVGPWSRGADSPGRAWQERDVRAASGSGRCGGEATTT